MTDVSKQLRAKLAEVAEIVLPEIVTVQTSSDGTEKLLLRLRDGALVETVILPSTGQDGSVRIAQCVSSQIGCAMGCTFCSTGTMGFIRNMTAGEILSQVLVARMRLGDNRIDHPIIRNLVFMGMGEPLLNLRETTRALEMLERRQGDGFLPPPHYRFDLRHQGGPARTRRQRPRLPCRLASRAQSGSPRQDHAQSRELGISTIPWRRWKAIRSRRASTSPSSISCSAA